MLVGEKVKGLRQKIGKNQIEFASSLGIPQSFLSAIESGKKKININITNKICSLYNVSASWLLDDKEDMASLYAETSTDKFNRIIKEMKQSFEDQDVAKYNNIKNNISDTALKKIYESEKSLRIKLDKINDLFNSKSLFQYVDFEIKTKELLNGKADQNTIDSILKEMKPDKKSLERIIIEIEPLLDKILLILDDSRVV